MTNDKFDKLLTVKHNIRKLENEIKQIKKCLINGILYPTKIEIFENTTVDVPNSLRLMIIHEILHIKKYFEEA